MNKDAKTPDEEWEGALFALFDEDVQQPSDENWTTIEQELFPNKKRRFGAFWIVTFVILSIGMGIVFFQKLSGNRNKISSKNQVNKEFYEQRKNEKNQSKHAHQKTNLNSQLIAITGKYGQSNNQEPKSKSIGIYNEFSPSTVNQPEIKKTQKTLTLKKNKETNSIEKIQSNSNTISQKTLQTAFYGTITSFDNEVIENSNEIFKNFDSVISLKLLPIQLFSISTKSIIQQIESIEKVDFKPYLSVQLAPLIGRNIRIISGTFNSGNNNSIAIGDRRVSLPKYGFQTGINYHIKNRLSVNVGFQLAGGDVESRWFFKYLQLDPSTNDVRFKTSSGEASTSDPTLIQSITNGTTGIYKLRLNHSFSLYSIPVGLTYRFTNEKFSPYIRSGVNMEFFGKRILSLDVMENGVTRNIELNLKRPNSGLSLQLMLALGIDSQLKGNWRFFAEAGYFTPLNQFVNTNGFLIKMAGSSILGGLKYDLK